MTDLHELCKFRIRPVDGRYLTELRYFLRNGIPSTYTEEEASNYINGIEEEAESTTTPLHIICRNYPEDVSEEEAKVINEMAAMLFEYGAGWCLVDAEGNTPGCLLVKRGLKHTDLYEQIVDAGVRAELLLRKVECNVEFVEQGNDDAQVEEQGTQPHVESVETETKAECATDPADSQEAYLSAKLRYEKGALVTEEQKDGVMMDWETDLMKRGCDTIFKGAYVDGKLDDEVAVLNIGFGMGIIDSFIAEKQPTKHYICEAHPDVLAKMKKDGWYDRPNVVVLEGTWKEQLDKLLSQGNIFFNGVYYDTFSEHYEDMLDLFDVLVGLLKPHGVFSFFNGLGADREVVYDVYKNLVSMDLSNYGLLCSFENVDMSNSRVNDTSEEGTDGSVWDNIKRPYWMCPVYYHPEVKFVEF